MTAVDDLHVGNWIAIVGDNQRSADNLPWFITPPGVQPEFSGEACQIVAVSLPFLLVWYPKQKKADTIDVRRFAVQKLHRTYVKRILALPTFTAPSSDQFSDDEEDSDEPEANRCPVCQGPMRQRSIAGNDMGWHLHCPECGFTGKLP